MTASNPPIVPAFDSVEVGMQVATRDVTITRADLIRYAGASGDFNVIHWNERIATAVGLPNVIAHGMFTMALAGRVVTDWVADPRAVREFGVRFTRPIPVPDDDHGAEVTVTATVAEKREGGLVRLDISAVHAGQSVLGRATAIVALA